MGSNDDIIGKITRASKELVNRVQENLEEATVRVQENIEELGLKVNALLEGKLGEKDKDGFAEENKRVAAFFADPEDQKLLAQLVPTAPKVSNKSFKLQKIIGRGSDDVLIYKAQERKLSKNVSAIKRIPVFIKSEGTSWEEDGVPRLKRLVHEVIFLQELQHVSPHIVELHGAGLFRTSKTSESRELWIVMEYVDGVDLSKLLEEDNIASLNVKQLSAVFAFATRAVNVLHSKEIAHRDIKGSNLILSRAGMIKVLDFDVACKLNDENRHPTFLAGSPAYMSPEMLDSKGSDFSSYIREGNVPVHDFKVDVWALGMTVLELALGEEPMSTIAQDNYEYVSEYLSGLELEEGQSAIGVILNDFFAEAPSYVDRWCKLIGFEGRNSQDYTLQRFHEDISNIGDIGEIFQREALESVDLIHYVAQCLTMSPTLRPPSSQLLNHPFVSGGIVELEALENILARKEVVKKGSYPLTVKEAAALHYGYENFVF